MPWLAHSLFCGTKILKYEICNKKYEIWKMITSLTVMWGHFHLVQKIWYEVLPMWISKVLQIVIRQIWPISHGVQFVSIYKHIQIQSGFQGYDQLTSVHTMSTLVQIFFCIEGWDKAIMQRRTINGMPEKSVEKYSEGGACIPLLLPMIFNNNKLPDLS